MVPKIYIKGKTESGDCYSATAELWKAYRESVDTDWVLAEHLEEGSNEDFFYTPEE
jgi:hypothetical protein